MSRFSSCARSIMSHRLTCLFFVCGILAFVYAGSISCENNVEYTCRGENFYCPHTQGCLPYSDRCTDMIGGSTDDTRCQQKSYTECDYTSGVFKAYRCSSKLSSSKKSVHLKREHQFITYRGLMYEFGCYGSRVQDPLDPKYEYRDGGRKYFGCVQVASSVTCTYEQIKRFSKPWTDEEYNILLNNCQDYAEALGEYIDIDCSMPKGRKREETSDLDFAKFVFSLSGNCTLNTTQLNTNSPSSPTVTTQLNTNSPSSPTVSLTMGMIIAIGIIAGLML